MNEKRRGAVIGAFIGDALSLGVHWWYDTSRITDIHGRYTELSDPPADGYHPGRKAGDFTHYGDQMLTLFAGIAETGAFDLERFSADWRGLFDGYDGYMDMATKKTLAWYARGKSATDAGSRAGDFAGASRIAPIVALYADMPEKLTAAVREQTAMTHNDPATLDTADFFARVTASVCRGTPPVRAMEKLAADYGASTVGLWVEKGIASVEKDTVIAIKDFGQACATSLVFPGVVHLIAKYESDPESALIEAVNAGGENAARAAMTGMVLGAHHGASALPSRWISGMTAWPEIQEYLNRTGV